VVRCANLPYDVLEKDLRELFSSVGKVVACQVQYDASGRSTGKATVEVSARRAAERAVERFHDATIDGRAIKVTTPPDDNVRDGLFGTALAAKP